MKKMLFALALVLSFTTLASAKDSVLCTVTAPEGAMLEQYPTSSGPLSIGQMAELGLRPIRITEPTRVLNHQRNLRGCAGGTWSAETLPAGTLVLADADGNLRYKQDCGNRIVVVVSEKAQTTTAVPALPAGDSTAATSLEASGDSGTSWWSPSGWAKDFMMFLLGFALLVAFMALLFWLLWHLLDWLLNNRPWGRPVPAPLVPPAPPAPLVVPAPVVAAPLPRPIPVGPVPVPVRTTRRYGPFASVVMTDRGAAGFQVVADGHDLGTFTNPVATEDAGPAGHYVVVTT